MLHTPVSSDGTTLNSRAFAGVSASVTLSSPFSPVNAGAWLPGFNSEPARLTALPLNVTVRGMVAPGVGGQESGVRRTPKPICGREADLGGGSGDDNSLLTPDSCLPTPAQLGLNS